MSDLGVREIFLEKSRSCSEKNFGLFRRLGIASPTIVNKSAGLLSLSLCFFICREGSVPMPTAAMPGVSPTLTAPTLRRVYHCIIMLCILYNPKEHPKSPPSPHGNQFHRHHTNQASYKSVLCSLNTT